MGYDAKLHAASALSGNIPDRAASRGVAEVVPRNNEHPLAGTLRWGFCNGHMRIAPVVSRWRPRAACANAHQRGTCEHTCSFDMDVISKGVCRNIDVKLLSKGHRGNAMSAWQEERKNDRKKGSERETL